MKPIEKIVIDANALLSIVIGGQAARRIVLHPKAPDLYAAVQAYSEVEKYLPILAERKKLNEKLLWSVWNMLPVEILAPPTNGPAWENAWNCLHQRDLDDVPTLALALEHHWPIWSQDKDFEEARDLCHVYSTAELLRILDG
ncbi:PIN domain-containing protein [Kyrpidia tusciae]|uniref:PilT domain-containing protein n=1 Tax=Kyrpidia tusciae (strain DSM 2912 / NBRC 15312 / T2) TaxID=562970 RepID=D5WWE1_KYRT2|nr:PIN domain-containing protein [Kyrpidia tusciae]ADG07706.1 PilT domain-containing protein [Kyrpidia tusciae DSM 2912]